MNPKRTIVITGATRGLGRSLIPHFVNSGHYVIGCGRSVEHVAALNREWSGKARFEAVDVADGDAVQNFARGVVSAEGPPDLLINNAAVMNQPGMLWEISAAEFDRVIDINIKGVAHVIRGFLPAMIGRAKGVVVNLSSGWGRTTAPQVAPYCATKYAIEGLSLAMAQEVPKGMAVIALNPGIIDTDMLRSAWGENAGRFPSAEKWAVRAAPFLLKLGAEHNGKSMNVSG